MDTFNTIITTIGVIGTFLGIFVALYVAKNNPSNYIDLSNNTYYAHIDKSKRRTNSKKETYSDIDDILDLIDDSVKSISHYGKIIFVLSLIFVIITFLLMLFEVYSFLPSRYLKLMLYIEGGFSKMLGVCSIFFLSYLPLKLFIFIYYDNKLKNKVEFFKLSGRKNLYWLKTEIKNTNPTFSERGYPLATIERTIKNKVSQPERDRIIRKNRNLDDKDKKSPPSERTAIFDSWYFWLFVILSVFNIFYTAEKTTPGYSENNMITSGEPALCYPAAKESDTYNWNVMWRENHANIYCDEKTEIKTPNGFSILESPLQPNYMWEHKQDASVKVKGYIIISDEKYYFTKYSYENINNSPRLIMIY